LDATQTANPTEIGKTRFLQGETMTAEVMPEVPAKPRRMCTGNVVRPDYRSQPVVSYAEAALIAGVSLSTIYYWVSRGRETKNFRRPRLPLIARRGAFRIAATDLHKFLRKA
jgi:hypothetical protein